MGASGSRTSQPWTAVPSEMVNSRSSRGKSSIRPDRAPCRCRISRSPPARSTTATSPYDVGVDETTAVGEPATEAPLTTRPGSATSGRGSPPSSGDGVQVRAATVADAEHDVTPVAGDLRHGARIAGAAGHDVAVERRREIDRVAAVERDAQEVRVRGRALVRVQCDGESAGAVRRPAEGDGSCVGERDQLVDRPSRRQ